MSSKRGSLGILRARLQQQLLMSKVSFSGSLERAPCMLTSQLPLIEAVQGDDQ